MSRETFDISKINLAKIADELRQYESQWVAISSRNEIVASGSTVSEVLALIGNPEGVVLFKVPPLHCAIAP